MERRRGCRNGRFWTHLNRNGESRTAHSQIFDGCRQQITTPIKPQPPRARGSAARNRGHGVTSSATPSPTDSFTSFSRPSRKLGQTLGGCSRLHRSQSRFLRNHVLLGSADARATVVCDNSRTTILSDGARRRTDRFARARDACANEVSASVGWGGVWADAVSLESAVANGKSIPTRLGQRMKNNQKICFEPIKPKSRLVAYIVSRTPRTFSSFSRPGSYSLPSRSLSRCSATVRSMASSTGVDSQPRRASLFVSRMCGYSR
ncbi:hypothetical protein SAMN05421858_0467 [Haladaptatus litoreus]|uniref:Uncharacterized protein n=1 Tax=Haladaptatus litoreus TaxID=553468 RepID=A0A1N6VSM6_9EURY|nr:hypothetical protein SAMN05421858_0467 [Haladaptatus litoreus]